MVYGETPNFNRGNEPSSFVPHYSFSNIGDYYGLTFVKSDEKDSTAASETYMTFNVDQPVEVMVAYEKFDHTRQTTKPEWLNDFRKLPGEIRAQLKYFDVYSKNFPAGRITLPGGDKVKHGVTTNYFVMIRREGFDNTPEINMQKLPAGYQGTYYEEGLSSLYGHGKLKWKLKSNRLPEGLRLSDDGKVSGIAGSQDTFFFEVLVTDEKGQTSQAKMKMEIR